MGENVLYIKKEIARVPAIIEWGRDRALVDLRTEEIVLYGFDYPNIQIRGKDNLPVVRITDTDIEEAHPTWEDQAWEDPTWEEAVVVGIDHLKAEGIYAEDVSEEGACEEKVAEKDLSVTDAIYFLCRDGIQPGTNLNREGESNGGRPYPHPFQINNGLCEDFAYHVADICDDARVDAPENHGFSPMDGRYGGHVWISDGEKFYDAEAPEGVSDWRRLPLFLRRESSRQ